MANTNKPSGFTPVKYLNGADWDGRGTMYYIDQTDTNAFFPGDLVIHAAGLDGASGLQTVTLATAGVALLGAIIAIGKSPSSTTSLRGGPYINPNDLTVTSAPATKTENWFCLVADDPNIIFEAQEIVVSAHAALTKVSTSLNANIFIGAPATGVKVSGWGIDNNTVATGATLPLKLMGLAQKFDQGAFNTFGAFAKWNCKINNHTYGSSTGTVGV
jgi:hypothetical protein